MNLRGAAAGAIAAFVLNWIWENAQAPFYKDYSGFAGNVWMCTVATFGDLVMVAAIWALVAMAWRDLAWHRRVASSRTAAAAAAGLAIAVAVEYWALATSRWAYEGMPLVPFTRIGLMPILQMIFIPPFVFALMGWCERRWRPAPVSRRPEPGG